jgi:pyruvate formate lyase activating enzyme
MKKTCLLCNEVPPLFSKRIGICPKCAVKHPEKVIQFSSILHENNRSKWDLPPVIPERNSGVQCKICSNKCQIEIGETSYCGIRHNINGKIKTITKKNQALLHTYYDPLPTNCCSTYFCPGGTGNGYPDFAYSKGPEYGYYNLACFLYACNFSCLGCQNDQHRSLRTAEKYSLNSFIERVKKNPKVSCICWFGGSPEPQLPWALRASRKAISNTSNSILRICWEWNGSGNPKLVQSAVALSLQTGGNAKFDLKYYSPILSQLISGVSNEQSFKNFQMCFDKFYHERRKNPVLTATTLLIPGYVDKNEVSSIAQFIAELDQSIPYSLLIFHPDSFLMDLPITPKQQVKECYEVAKKYLKNVHIGNKHLLGLFF